MSNPPKEEAALEVITRLCKSDGVHLPREIAWDLREELVRRLDLIRWDEARLGAALSASREHWRKLNGVSGDCWNAAAFLDYVRDFGFPIPPTTAREAEIAFGGIKTCSSARSPQEAAPRGSLRPPNPAV